MPEQLDMFGGAIDAAEVAIKGQLAELIRVERDHGSRLTADEAGAVIHELRGKHPRDQRCPWCCEDGIQALVRLRERRDQLDVTPPPMPGGSS